MNSTVTKMYPAQSPQLSIVSPTRQPNEEQLAAIRSIDGINLIESGAGTGKTTCIVGKIQEIHRQHPKAHMLLIISFTRKAVDEIKQRLDNQQYVQVMTFHSLFYRILTANGMKSYTLINDTQQRNIARFALERLNLQDKATVEEIIESLNRAPKKQTVKLLRKEYLAIERGRHLFDFDSMQIMCYNLLKENPGILKRLQQMYRYILVDEFQDVNKVQWEILKLLAPRSAKTNLTVVGDPRQAIYSFRGSYPEVLDEFSAFYGSRVKRFCLIKNYRSTPAILDLGNRLMPEQDQLTAVHTQGDMQKPVFYAASDDQDEAVFIANHIKALHLAGQSYKDMVVLYRSVGVTAALLPKLISDKVPVVRLNGGFLFDLPVYKLIRSCFKVGTNNYTSYDMRRLLPVMEIPEEKYPEIKKWAAANSLPFLDAVVSLTEDKKKMAADFIAAVRATQNQSVKDSVIRLWQSGLGSFLHDDDSLLDTVLSHLQRYVTPQEWFRAIERERKQYDAMLELSRKKDADYIQIMSIHAAKGTEFKTVFLAGAADGVLPDTAHEETDLAEEKRLAYVAVTRAKERLYISFPQQSHSNKNKPSRFFEKAF